MFVGNEESTSVCDNDGKLCVVVCNGDVHYARPLTFRDRFTPGRMLVLTDGDVYGEHIAMVIKSGSANAAHLRELTVPDAKWVGVWATDIEKYKLPTIPMTESDIKRCYDLQKDPRYLDGIWKKELEVFLRLKRKAELEAFSKYGLTNITDKYLPQKLELAKSL